MNCCRRPIRALSFVAIAGMGTSATAGELGPSSRASVGISITIPPHVSLNPGREINGQINPAEGICVQANGLNNYRLTMLDAGGSLEAVNVAVRSNITSAIGNEAVCGHATGVREAPISYWLSSNPKQQTGTLMIVVTPD